LIGDKRDSVAVTTTATDIDNNADGGSVLVALTGAWNGTVDFQTTVDGTNYFNIPYINRTELYPSPSIAQIDDISSTAKLYLLLGPISQFRISCSSATVGTLTVAWRTIQGPYIPINVFTTPDGDSLLNDTTDTLKVSLPSSTGVTGLNDLIGVLDALLVELRRSNRIGELTLGSEVAR